MKKKPKLPDFPPPFLPPEGGLSGSIQTDPQGSYTGLPEQPLEEPVQDGDDL